MRKTLDFAVLKFPEIRKQQLDMDMAKECFDIIYRKRREYIEKVGRDPVGITLPLRLFLIFEMHKHEFFHTVQVCQERKMTLFGLDIYPVCGDVFSFIPNQADVTRLAMEESDL
jgi:hypothetical protein